MILFRPLLPALKELSVYDIGQVWRKMYLQFHLNLYEDDDTNTIKELSVYDIGQVQICKNT